MICDSRALRRGRDLDRNERMSLNGAKHSPKWRPLHRWRSISSEHLRLPHLSEPRVRSPFRPSGFPLSPPPFIQAHLYSFQRSGRRYRPCAPTRPRPSAAWARSWGRSREAARTATARVSRHKIIFFFVVEIFFAAVEELEVARLRPRPALLETKLFVTSRSYL